MLVIYKKRLLLILFICKTGLIIAQNPDVAASYMLREFHIELARIYNTSIDQNRPYVLRYGALKTFSHKLTKSNSMGNLPPFDLTIDEILKVGINCISIYPIKTFRCKKRAELLQMAYVLVNTILYSPTIFPINNAVKNKLSVEGMAIQSLIKDYILE